MADEARQRLVDAMSGPSYSLADFLQERRNPLLDQWYATPPTQPNALAPHSYSVSEFTTPDEMRQERISQGLGWDTTRPGARFRETLVSHLPFMLGFIGPRVAPLAPPPRSAPNPNVRPWSQNEEWSLSFNQGRTPDRFKYEIMRRGEPVGVASGRVSGDEAYIGWIGPRFVYDTLRPQDIGVGGLRALREYIRSDFPEVRTFTGNRISGARRGPAAQMEPAGDTVNQTVRMRSLAPLGLLGLMDDQR